MKQRVSLGCAIVHKPLIVFLDEPTVGLDPDLRAHFWEYFESLTETGTTLIISSHTLDDASHCRELVFMREGRIIARGTPEQLKADTRQAKATLEDAFLYYYRREGEKSDVK
jgi:ABC-2 type transport system ATP-binding protein